MRVADAQLLRHTQRYTPSYTRESSGVNTRRRHPRHTDARQIMKGLSREGFSIAVGRAGLCIRAYAPRGRRETEEYFPFAPNPSPQIVNIEGEAYGGHGGDERRVAERESRSLGTANPGGATGGWRDGEQCWALAGETVEQENRRLRREVATLQQEQAFVKKMRRTSRKSRVEVRRDRSPLGRVSCATHVPPARGLSRRSLCLSQAPGALAGGGSTTC